MELTRSDALRAYARMINTRNVSLLEPLLADDFHYASQSVFDEITTRRKFLDYIRPKLRVIVRGDTPAFAEMGMLSTRYGGGPCVVLGQGTRETQVGTVLAETAAGRITRIDLCVVPPPQAAQRSGDYPSWRENPAQGARTSGQ